MKHVPAYAFCGIMVGLLLFLGGVSRLLHESPDFSKAGAIAAIIMGLLLIVSFTAKGIRGT